MSGFRYPNSPFWFMPSSMGQFQGCFPSTVPMTSQAIGQSVIPLSTSTQPIRQVITYSVIVDQPVAQPWLRSQSSNQMAAPSGLRPPVSVNQRLGQSPSVDVSDDDPQEGVSVYDDDDQEMGDIDEHDQIDRETQSKQYYRFKDMFSSEKLIRFYQRLVTSVT